MYAEIIMTCYKDGQNGVFRTEFEINTEQFGHWVIDGLSQQKCETKGNKMERYNGRGIIPLLSRTHTKKLTDFRKNDSNDNAHTERGGSVVTHETLIREVPGSNPVADQPG